MGGDRIRLFFPARKGLRGFSASWGLGGRFQALRGPPRGDVSTGVNAGARGTAVGGVVFVCAAALAAWSTALPAQDPVEAAWTLAKKDEWKPTRPDEAYVNPSLGTLRIPPFYGVELHPSAFASAGLVANAAAQVIGPRERPIPGLYAAGNNAAHTEYGVGYQAGFSLGSGMTFGYLAARHMAGLN